jgi:hypothetical protein
MSNFTVGKDINITGLKERSLVNIPYHIIENTFGMPTFIEGSNVMWKIQFDAGVARIYNDYSYSDYKNATQWNVKASNKSTIDALKNILSDI